MTHNPRHLPMPRALAFDVFQHEFQHGRYAAYAKAERNKAYNIAQDYIINEILRDSGIGQAMTIDAILAGG
jgi:DNA gyrase inhibitor GyrI